jgi:predicted acylesterase/phospholipase RssA
LTIARATSGAGTWYAKSSTDEAGDLVLVLKRVAAGDHAAGAAFAFAGGGSLGAVQVGMLKALMRIQVLPDFIVGASVGAINGAYIAAEPDLAGVGRRDHLVPPGFL